MKDTYLEETPLLNYSHPSIQAIVDKWASDDDFNKIKNAYEFVQNDVLFGYNATDEMAASEVLSDHYGQCNTKATLLMAMLRALNIPTRLHGALVDKDFQAGALPKLVSRLSPQTIVHTWVEVFYDDKWHALEGVIIDQDYFKSVQNKSGVTCGSFEKYAIATDDFTPESVAWRGDSTYIQSTAVTEDLGVYDSPDDFFSSHQQQLGPIKLWLYTNIATKWMTWNVKRVRR